MASGGSLMTKELGETHDVLRFGANDSVRGDLAPAHPVQATIHKEAKFWDEKKKFGTEAIYGSAFNIRRDLDAQILSSIDGERRYGAPRVGSKGSRRCMAVCCSAVWLEDGWLEVVFVAGQVIWRDVWRLPRSWEAP
ncbi:cyclin-B1-2-like isoform X1 [Triticum dicoccoides]|uniref:cyclin-B1-2-like isoform X1 n=1 Tax=Triticum dicoccoides TaxID=85692 RepID=UPI00188EBF00|nr:cyclin-B1-2-like isoform X1 [Triticum dicoccoides]XP_037419811.1 cyclin-B1-2-like isoform X1 [Triticum dicoccoides]